jgi:hypothetical protein
MMEKNAKIFVAGHRGLVGSAILNNLKKKDIPISFFVHIRSLIYVTKLL